ARDTAVAIKPLVSGVKMIFAMPCGPFMFLIVIVARPWAVSTTEISMAALEGGTPAMEGVPAVATSLNSTSWFFVVCARALFILIARLLFVDGAERCQMTSGLTEPLVVGHGCRS